MFLDSLFGRLFKLQTTWAARGQSWNELIAHLENGPRALSVQVARAKDSQLNRRQLRHITGIERWGQQRLRTLLGEPYTRDEYDGYQPDDSLPVPDLWDAFTTTRRETIALARLLQSKGVSLRATAPHNDAGDLSVGAWLVYLRQHAAREGMVIR